MWPDCAANSRPKLLIFRTPSLYFPADSSVDPDNAMLIYKAVFDCWPRVKVSVNLTRDAVTPKLVQLRFETIE